MPKMSKLFPGRHKTTLLLTDGVMFLGGALVAFLFFWSFWCFTTPSPQFSTPSTPTRPDPTTFYDDPEVSYWIGNPVQNWDDKRRQWMAQNPSFSGSKKRVIMVTGSQPQPCKSPTGDHLLLRMFKNKVDYCRLHGYDIFYNNVLLHPKMHGFWAKYAGIRAAMVAHPESEWIWWVDSDAVITDMDFTIPFEKYRAHNLVIHGWPNLVYKKRSWTGINAGVFLIRNCQWSMDLIEKWVGYGPQSPEYEKWGRVQKEEFPDKMFPGSDDQTGLEYLMVKGDKKWGEKIYLESEYYFQGYWVEIVGNLEDVKKKYEEIEGRVHRLRRRQGEKNGESYGAQWEEHTKGDGGLMRRPFITHFTGCEPCSGEHNAGMYTWEECWDGMIKALNFGDDQVLKYWGYSRPDLMNTSWVQPFLV